MQGSTGDGKIGTGRILLEARKESLSHCCCRDAMVVFSEISGGDKRSVMVDPVGWSAGHRV